MYFLFISIIGVVGVVSNWCVVFGKLLVIGNMIVSGFVGWCLCVWSVVIVLLLCVL